MKKVIAILAVMMVFAGIVFATTGDNLTINATVPVTKPEFTMVGGFTNEYGTTATGILNSQIDISTNPIDVYVQIKQIRTPPVLTSQSLLQLFPQQSRELPIQLLFRQSPLQPQGLL